MRFDLHVQLNVLSNLPFAWHVSFFDPPVKPCPHLAVHVSSNRYGCPLVRQPDECSSTLGMPHDFFLHFPEPFGSYPALQLHCPLSWHELCVQPPQSHLMPSHR
jgi:hypothetical protein